MKRFLARLGYVHLISRHFDEVYLRAVIKIQVSCQRQTPIAGISIDALTNQQNGVWCYVCKSIFRGFRLRNKVHCVVVKLQQHAVLQIQSLIRGVQARERVCILRFEQKSDRRKLAGEPLQFTLPSRSRPVAATSTVRALYEHRKTRAKLEFKTPKWREERLHLKIHVSRPQKKAPILQCQRTDTDVHLGRRYPR